jgi:hypothetical protein
MDSYRGCLTLLFWGVLAIKGFAFDPPKEVGQIRPVNIIEISSIKTISEHIEAEAVRSFLEVEIAGTYQGHGQSENLVGQIENTFSSVDSSRGELKLYSVDLKPEALKAIGGFNTAQWAPTPFRLTVKVAPTMWAPSGNASFAGPQTGMQWGVTASVKRYSPIWYEHQYGFHAYLSHSPSSKAWAMYPIGLNPAHKP